MNAQLVAEFETVYRAHSRWVLSLISSRLFKPDAHLAEDLTAEAFLSYWRKMTAGVEIEHPQAMLKLIADRVIVDHFRRPSSRETATDFAFSNATEAVSGAGETPHLAGLLGELEFAKDVLTAAAARYRRAGKGRSLALARIATARRAETVALAEAALVRLDGERSVALAEFAAAGRRVRELRAAWNADAGQMHGLVPVTEKAATR